MHWYIAIADTPLLILADIATYYAIDFRWLLLTFNWYYYISHYATLISLAIELAVATLAADDDSRHLLAASRLFLAEQPVRFGQ